MVGMPVARRYRLVAGGGAPPGPRPPRALPPLPRPVGGPHPRVRCRTPGHRGSAHRRLLSLYNDAIILTTPLSPWSDGRARGEGSAMTRLTDYTSYADAHRHFSSAALWG